VPGPGVREDTDAGRLLLRAGVIGKWVGGGRGGNVRVSTRAARAGGVVVRRGVGGIEGAG